MHGKPFNGLCFNLLRDGRVLWRQQLGKHLINTLKYMVASQGLDADASASIETRKYPGRKSEIDQVCIWIGPQ